MKTAVRAAFGRAAGSYDGAAHVQRCVADQLAACLLPTRRRLTVVDGGCGTGYACRRLRALFPNAVLLALDFASPMLTSLNGHSAAASALPLCADLESVPIADGAIDLYWSSMALQWCSLPTALAEASRVLRPGGRLCFATLSCRTFHELRDAFAAIDGNAHAHEFLAPESIRSAVATAGFREIALRRAEVVAIYPDLRSLLLEIKAAGASEFGGQRRRGMLGRGAWSSIQARYGMHARKDGLPATYDVVFVSARKPG